MLPRLHRGVPGAAPRVRGHGEQRRLACPWQDRAMETLQRVAIIFVVAVIFGLVNAFIKPIVQILSIPLYILTLGLFHVVVNASMLWLTAWITEHTTHWGLQIDHFWWTAIWAAILLSIVSWILSLLARDFRRVTRAH
ncbi:phage holin family protein [Mycobacterium tuberculosis]|nr:phage holin family protein [Mycobacterium tuberculosis]